MLRPDHDVIVRVEVLVPSAQVRHSVQELLNGNIALPQAGQANVKEGAQGGSGTICAKGSGAIKGGTLAQFVYAKVYTGSRPPPPIPLNPPPMTDSTIPFGANGDWVFASLAGADCNAAGTAANTLVIWIDHGGPGYEVISRQFTGKCATGTDCDSGSGGMIAPCPGQAETAPRQWRVVASGFSGDFKTFNDICLLNATGQAQQAPTAWDNGQDGKKKARVSLAFDSDAKRWTLTFKRGRAEVRYATSAERWRPLNANVLELMTSDQADRAPQLLVVLPE